VTLLHHQLTTAAELTFWASARIKALLSVSTLLWGAIEAARTPAALARAPAR
jgi:hypothetical protein